MTTVLSDLLTFTRGQKHYNGEGIDGITKKIELLNDTLKNVSYVHGENADAVVTLKTAFEYLGKEVKALAEKETPAPVVNVEAPVVTVPEPTIIEKQDPFSETIARTLIEILQRQTNEVRITNARPQDAIPVVLTDRSLKKFYDAISQIVTTQSNPINPDFSVLVDEADAVTVYIGYADPGIAEDAPNWKIKRMDTSITGQTKIKWAGGSPRFAFAWDDRASLSYF